MLRTLLLALALALPGAALAAAEPPAAGPFTDVPASHWSYDAVAALAARGISTGYPKEAFNRKRLLTRYEFAVALQRVVQEVQLRPSAPGAPASGALPVAEVVRLEKLTEEFRPELAMLGADTALVRRNLAALRNRLAGTEIPWRGAVPDLATPAGAAYPGGTPSLSDPAYVRGYWQAVQEWQRGEVVFYTTELSGHGVSNSTGLAYRPVPGKPDAAETLAFIAGHNTEVRRRVRTLPIPRGARRLEPHFDAVTIWRPLAEEALKKIAPEDLDAFVRPAPVRLQRAHPETTSPDGRTHVRLEEQGKAGLVLRVARSGHEYPLRFEHLSAPGDEVRVVWGNPEADLLFVRCRPAAAEPSDEVVVQVVDLRTGGVLIREQVPASFVDLPYNPFAIRMVNPFIEETDL